MLLGSPGRESGRSVARSLGVGFEVETWVGADRREHKLDLAADR